MKQSEAFERLTKIAEDRNALIVADIGSQSLWLKEAKDRPENLYLSGPMGMASSVALGVAMACKDRAVIAACGDGALGMNLSSLATISNAAPKNLSVVVMDNSIYEFTKSLPTPTRGINWNHISLACPGFQSNIALKDMKDLDLLSGPHFIHAEITPGKLPPDLGMNAIDVHHRFKAYLNNLG
ncbi:MAG TPA: thiamine pyrophosphate-dependent enzyme [Alphaproteobacteria bacterium]|nr:sulfopyruvate decarboxylase subunit beta [Alphaproteobacteria bacterium]USO05923.1 MAG: sulfopyruvate decarboxylase subunit beta [Rhodospirillales bacterium]HOO81315.1 thiamine pyrophosphate-dependent enzyme [Alphaproteobacteria bacterium]